jgi:hypothetical protein
MSFTEQQVQKELKKQGITSLDVLARKIAEQSAAKARFNQARGLSERDDPDYLWSGKNYSLYHGE